MKHYNGVLPTAKDKRGRPKTAHCPVIFDTQYILCYDVYCDFLDYFVSHGDMYLF